MTKTERQRVQTAARLVRLYGAPSVRRLVRAFEADAPLEPLRIKYGVTVRTLMDWRKALGKTTTAYRVHSDMLALPDQPDRLD